MFVYLAGIDATVHVSSAEFGGSVESVSVLRVVAAVLVGVDVDAQSLQNISAPPAVRRSAPPSHETSLANQLTHSSLARVSGQKCGLQFIHQI